MRTPMLRLAASVVFIALLAAAAAGARAAAPQETVLYSFCSLAACADGDSPNAGLVADRAGNLYGTTVGGGAYQDQYGNGYGTVFKLAPDGEETVLHSFTGGADGASPFYGLIIDRAGNLYGTTGGGAYGAGNVFKLAPEGEETVLYSFTGGADGRGPTGTLIADRAGNLYGTTAEGGAYGYGTVFKISPAGEETVLYSFTGGADEGVPLYGVVADSAGNLYGSAGDTVFKLTPAGVETVLYTFCTFAGCRDGNLPSNLTIDSAGDLYGTAVDGGAQGDGVVFQITPGGEETVLYSFTGSNGAVNGDGGIPNAGVIIDAAGNLYGTTTYGGPTNFMGYGTVFKVTPEGEETVLYAFGGGADGGLPYAPLIADRAGNLYGTTEYLGANGGGTVFKLTNTGFVTPAVELTALLAEVTGVGPGRSLETKVKLAQKFYSANDIPETCATLTSLVLEVKAQDGKKISQSAAGQIIADAMAIQTAIGCQAGDRCRATGP